MSTADDLGYEDPNEPDPQAAARAAKEAAFAKRQAERDAERKELADLREYKAKTERESALTAAKADLNAQGPLGAFLKTYTGEPDADAIKAAVAADPDFASLITFPPDPRDAAAAEQARNAQAIATGQVSAGQITPKDAAGWPTDKQKQFRDEHSAAWATLMRNEPVAAPAGWA